MLKPFIKINSEYINANFVTRIFSMKNGASYDVRIEVVGAGDILAFQANKDSLKQELKNLKEEIEVCQGLLGVVEADPDYECNEEELGYIEKHGNIRGIQRALPRLEEKALEIEIKLEMSKDSYTSDLDNYLAGWAEEMTREYTLMVARAQTVKTHV